MKKYYKATRPNGTDFRTGTIDYAAALASGEVVTHPAAKRLKDDPSTYLSGSTVPTDCTGFSWPCRLFTVENAGARVTKATSPPNKRCLTALRVVGELPAWQAFGPQGERVVAILDRCRTLDRGEIRRLAAARTAAWDAARTAAWYAAWYAARTAAWDAARTAAWDAARTAAWYAAWYAARDAARDAARTAAWYAAWYAARDAALAVLTQDLISVKRFELLYRPWREVIDNA